MLGSSIPIRRVRLAAMFLAFLGCGRPDAPGNEARSTRYQDLLALFDDWRRFQQPRMVEGVPNYTAQAMSAQYGELAAYRRRLAAIDPSGWPVPRQVNYHLVRVEMNGLDFSHRVLRPWARDPAFYVWVYTAQSDAPVHDGPAVGGIELWSYPDPLPADRAADLGARLRAVPKLLQQARGNLVDNARDLWIAGTNSMKNQSRDLAALVTRLESASLDLARDARQAQVATDQFVVWLEQQAPSKTGPSGIGIENYNWWLRNVQLVPYTWAEQVALMQRELGRALSGLKLEEQRNRKLPPMEPVATEDEYVRRFNAGVTDYIAFLRDTPIMTVKDYMEPALRARVGRFAPPGPPREFFNEVEYRDRSVMRTHDFHWIDIAWLGAEPPGDPIRRGPMLYDIFVTRTEGFATAMEELILNAGFFDRHPRTRELLYILVAQRAARALGDLRMHSNEFTLEQAVRFAARWTPRGWLREDGNLVWGEQHYYLQQPAFGPSYLIGKMQIEQLLGERAQQLGREFTIKRFMDEFIGAGLIPVSLIRWELTGEADEVERMSAP